MVRPDRCAGTAALRIGGAESRVAEGRLRRGSRTAAGRKVLTGLKGSTGFSAVPCFLAVLAGGGEPLPGSLQPFLAAPGQGLAPFPEGEGILEARPAGFKFGDDAYQLFACLLVAQRLDVCGNGRCR